MWLDAAGGEIDRQPDRVTLLDAARLMRRSSRLVSAGYAEFVAASCSRTGPGPLTGDADHAGVPISSCTIENSTTRPTAKEIGRGRLVRRSRAFARPRRYWNLRRNGTTLPARQSSMEARHASKAIDPRRVTPRRCLSNVGGEARTPRRRHTAMRHRTVRTPSARSPGTTVETFWSYGRDPAVAQTIERALRSVQGRGSAAGHRCHEFLGSVDSIGSRPSEQRPVCDLAR